MKIIRIIGRILLFIFIVLILAVLAIVHSEYDRKQSIIALNNNIDHWHKERDNLYAIEELSFEGKVINLLPARHRGSIDTVVVKLNSWNSFDSLFTGNHALIRISDSIILIFIEYLEFTRGPNRIVIGDNISKGKFSFDFSVNSSTARFKKNLSLLYCEYGSPDTIIQTGNFIFALKDKSDTLYRGILQDNKRNGKWKYLEIYYASHNVIFEGNYLQNKRNGKFHKHYERTNQLTYEEEYEGNLPNGKFIWWYSNGQIESIKYFLMGHPTGVWKFYDKHGVLIKSENHGKEMKMVKTKD